MKYMAKDSMDLIHNFGERIAGPVLSRDIARLYSQHTRLRAGAKGLPTWSDDEAFLRLVEAEKLLIAGMAIAESTEQRRYLRRAGEIFEWVATSSSVKIPTSVVLLAASSYQLAGFPARASGILAEHPLPDNTSNILAALLRSDFPEAQRLLIETWQLDQKNGIGDERRLGHALLDQILRALGVMTAWLRWGEEARIDTALITLKKTSKALHYDSDRYSWLLAVVFAEIAQGYKKDSLWTVLSPLMTTVSDDGRRAFTSYARNAFLEKKLLAWPSQQAGITSIISEGSFALCTPTGSGKTRVAELAILRHLFKQTDDQSFSDTPFVLYLAPSRALSAEVEAGLSRTLRSIKATSVTVTSLYGGNDFGPSDLMNTGDQPTVLISTHEKADALLRFFGSTMLKQISCVIVDEAHTVTFTGEYEKLTRAESRSLRLEGLVNRLRTLCSPETTFVALSAVAAEVRDVLAEWITGVDGRQAIAPDYRSTRQLFGKLLCTESGATMIQYDVLDGQSLSVDDRDSAPYVPNPFPSHPNATKTFKDTDSIEKRMRAHLLWAAMYFAQLSDGKRHSVLISAMEHPEYYAKTFLDLLTGDWAKVECPDFFAPPVDAQNQLIFSRCLASCEDYFGSMSREYRLLKKGIVLHHGKMPPVMSRLLIELIQSRVINIVIATSTLSEGVNLPFETVLIPSLLRSGSVVNAKEIINVAGRAGRPGISTEGRTLVLFPAKGQKSKSQYAYENIITGLTELTKTNSSGLVSPLCALISHIEEKWRQVSRSTNPKEFIIWLETTAYSQMEGEPGELITSLDTLDQQLLTGIEEAQSLIPETDVEEFLQKLWRNTLAQYDNNFINEGVAKEVFVKRGKALIKSIYPDKVRRKKLYYTGLPPRDGSVLIDNLPEMKKILQKAEDYAKWDISARIEHFVSLVDMISNIKSFSINGQELNRSTPWTDVFKWWMTPDSTTYNLNPESVSRWYDFAAKNFIYRLNWALGAVIGSILEHDGGKEDILVRWKQSKLPWAVMWYKDMISWGTLDPIASCVLTRKEAYTRSDATKIAAEYWKATNEISDAALEPKRVIEWLNTRKKSHSTSAEEHSLSISKITVELIEDFSKYKGPALRVLPARLDHSLDWYDPAGFLLARSNIPKDWQGLKSIETDFMLVPSSSIVTWEHYV